MLGLQWRQLSQLSAPAEWDLSQNCVMMSQLRACQGHVS